MLDATIPVREPIRAAITPLGAKLYTDQRAEADGTVKYPHVWIYSTTESDAAVRIYGFLEDIVTLDGYARSLRGLANLEDALEFLDDYRAPTYGNAILPHYLMQSKTRTPEADGLWHLTILLACRYVDLRKFQTA